MRVLLIGNYRPDAQESMLRFARLMHVGLLDAGHEVTLVAPRQMLKGSAPTGIGKWIGYIDKYVLSPRALRRAAGVADIVHVCDHSNALYVPSRLSKAPYVVTCHDLLAVRGARGEVPDCAASATGRFLQSAILAGLRRAQAVACVSKATQRDAKRLLNGYTDVIEHVPNALNHQYRRLEAQTARDRLAAVETLRDGRPFVLNVGSNQRRKNRECALRAVASIANSWNGRLVLAGPPLSAELRSLAHDLELQDRVVEVVKPSNEVLEALYNVAHALLFPSRFEGFGWPIVEAQACGCPVISSDREPMPEVSGGAAVLCDPDDHAAFGRAILELESDQGRRGALIDDGLANLRRFERSMMIGQYVSLYKRVSGQS